MSGGSNADVYHYLRQSELVLPSPPPMTPQVTILKLKFRKEIMALKNLFVTNVLPYLHFEDIF